MSQTEMQTEDDGVLRDAVLSGCQRFRYHLSRRWGPGPALAWLMLNPSMADGLVDDPTIRRCMAFGRREGYDAIHVLNLFAFRTTKPADLTRRLRLGHDVVGPDNDRVLRDMAYLHGMVVVAWGAHEFAYDGRVQQVMPVLYRTGIQVQCLGLTNKGMPRHPLFVPADAPLMAFSAANIERAMRPTQPAREQP